MSSFRAVLGASMSATLVVACWPLNALDDCDQNPNLACFWEGLSSGTVSASGGDGGTSKECVPSENAGAVRNDCGVFVSSTKGDDSNVGTKEKPVATLAKAVQLANAGRARVYACAEMFEEALSLDSAVEVYGGLECEKGWAHGGAEAKTTLKADADEIPLHIRNGVTEARFVDLAIVAVDAADEGGSSIGVLADGATAEFIRCELVAGKGAKGVAGTPGDPNETVAKSGAVGNAGKNACSDLDGMSGPDTTLPGGMLVTSDCGSGDVSVGGGGGDGTVAIGVDGSAGQTGTKGQAGMGEPSMGTWDCDVGGGKIGSSGEAGVPGLGATALGTLSTSGYVATSGGAGTSGKAGQGGGGGGGAKGGMICPGGTTGSGASGGSGGAGGCGGLPGQGGGPGGASIALVSLNASITLTNCVLSAGQGGDGGAGGDAQGGGPGGLPGLGGLGVGVSNPGCSGGQGGKGGNGGPGGGGLGGPSLGIAFQGSAPEASGKTTVTPGMSGVGGPGGNANVANNAGASGIAAAQQEFPKP